MAAAGFILTFIAAGGAQPAAPAGKPAASPVAKAGATNAAPAVVEIPKSVFLDRPAPGKDLYLDPFYINSTRRKPKPAPNVANQANGAPAVPAVVVKPPLPSEFISLKGILGSKSKPIALIGTGVKTYEFEKGESQSVKIPDAAKAADNRVKIRVLEIKGESVVIKIESEVEHLETELNLRRGIK